jgi:glycosyltransferase involved in cell wall biosynthesis
LSNLIKEKGINVLLEAAKKKKSKGIFIQLKVAGNTIKENDLSRYFNNLDGVDYVLFTARKVNCFGALFFVYPIYYKWRSAY